MRAPRGGGAAPTVVPPLRQPPPPPAFLPLPRCRGGCAASSRPRQVDGGDDEGAAPPAPGPVLLPRPLRPALVSPGRAAGPRSRGGGASSEASRGRGCPCCSGFLGRREPALSPAAATLPGSPGRSCCPGWGAFCLPWLWRGEGPGRDARSGRWKWGWWREGKKGASLWKNNNVLPCWQHTVLH